MKKHLYIALSVPALISLAACGGADQTAEPEQPVKVEKASPEAQSDATTGNASEAQAEMETMAPDATAEQSEAKPEPNPNTTKPKPSPKPKAPAAPPTKTTPPPAEPDPHAGHDMNDMK